MARGQQIDQDELFETANRLNDEGKEVTALALLNALGRGSLTTIYRYLDVWKAARPATIASGNNEIPEQVKSAFAGAWRVAAQEAAKEIEEVKAKAADDVKEAQKQFHGALEAIEKLEKENDTCYEEIENLKKQALDRQVEMSKLESDSAAQKAAADELRHQVDTQKKELERLHAELEKARKERDDSMKESSELKGQAKTLQLQNEQLMKAVTEKK